MGASLQEQLQQVDEELAEVRHQLKNMLEWRRKAALKFLRNHGSFAKP